VLTRLLTTCALLATLSPAGPVQAQPGLPSGGDQVVIGRLFHRGPAGTIAVARFGLILAKSRPSSVSLEVPRRDDDPAAGYTLAISAERRRGAARLEWSLQPGGAANLGAGRGSQEVLSGVLGHLSIAEVDGTRIYASVENGRASSFDVLKLARHFGVAIGGPAPPAPALRQVAPSTAAVVVAPRAPATPAPVASAGILNLSFQLLQDGEVAFAPRVRVREGQAFSVRGGQALEAGGERWDGFELSGLARMQGGRCLIDLAVQSGRSLSGGAAPTWLVDRYRRDVAVTPGVESELALFEDLEGEGGGSLRLLMSCSRE